MKGEAMKKLKAKLMELQKQGYETVTIAQVLNWIYMFERRRKKGK
jgi:hypothetical protein